MSINKEIPKIQRALVLQGGGALGAYEAGVLKVLCQKLTEEDKENGEEHRLLFDIVAGTSIGAMNSTVLVSQFLQAKKEQLERKEKIISVGECWEEAVKQLEEFWNDKDKGLATTPDINIEKLPFLQDEWYKEALGAASKESARRYYSVKHFFTYGAPKMYLPMLPRADFKFFDDSNKWLLIYSNKPLQETIQRFAEFPIATSFNDKEPRLLVFSIDVAEGKTVTFDSYPKADNSRKSEYGKYKKKNKEGYEHVIRYPGITIEHVMASGTIPELYDYAKVPLDQTKNEQERQDITDTQAKDNENNNSIRYFWDGGVLSNTPLRELLEAHQEYWSYVENKDKIPDLDIYIVNVHPSKIETDMIPKDYDGVKDRHNDIKYGDRTSQYDENIAQLISDHTSFVTQMKHLAEDAIQQVNKQNNREELQRRLEDILTTNTTSKNRKDEVRKYNDLLSSGFKLNKVLRIERTNYINSISGKGGDVTLQTINKLIKEGELDAWISIIQDNINGMQLPVSASDIQYNLIDRLNEAADNLKSKDYEDNAKVSDKLSKFIDEVNKNKQSIDKLKPGQSVKLIELAEAFKSRLQK
jgi:NTE family protein